MAKDGVELPHTKKKTEADDACRPPFCFLTSTLKLSAPRFLLGSGHALLVHGAYAVAGHFASVQRGAGPDSACAGAGFFPSHRTRANGLPNLTAERANNATTNVMSTIDNISNSVNMIQTPF